MKVGLCLHTSTCMVANYRNLGLIPVECLGKLTSATSSKSTDEIEPVLPQVITHGVVDGLPSI